MLNTGTVTLTGALLAAPSRQPAGSIRWFLFRTLSASTPLTLPSLVALVPRHNRSLPHAPRGSV